MLVGPSWMTRRGWPPVLNRTSDARPAFSLMMAGLPPNGVHLKWQRPLPTRNLSPNAENNPPAPPSMSLREKMQRFLVSAAGDSALEHSFSWRLKSVTSSTFQVNSTSRRVVKLQHFCRILTALDSKMHRVCSLILMFISSMGKFKTTSATQQHLHVTIVTCCC